MQRCDLPLVSTTKLLCKMHPDDRLNFGRVQMFPAFPGRYYLVANIVSTEQGLQPCHTNGAVDVPDANPPSCQVSPRYALKLHCCLDLLEVEMPKLAMQMSSPPLLQLTRSLHRVREKNTAVSIRSGLTAQSSVSHLSVAAL